MNRAEWKQPEVPARTGTDIRQVFVRNLILAASIGVHRHEQDHRQRVRVNLDLSVVDEGPTHDALSEVVCYETITEEVRAIVTGPHCNLVETLAERVADACLRDVRVAAVRVRVEKLDVWTDVESVGVEIERVNPAYSKGLNANSD
jgi:dihydroneopterin aldolase